MSVWLLRILVAAGALVFLYALLTTPSSRTLLRRKVEALRREGRLPDGSGERGRGDEGAAR